MRFYEFAIGVLCAFIAFLLLVFMIVFEANHPINPAAFEGDWHAPRIESRSL